tara:strand:- start:1011 stop:1223 length:213 start_codon:yes stop_codon:yes gene_type:complete
MNYDNWKLSTPEYSSTISACCGAQVIDEYCEDQDANFDICEDCGDECSAIDQGEYDERRREDAMEFNRDE